MPCGDVTETLRARFGADGRLLEYSLRKRTCGGAVGAAALLLPHVRGLTAEEVLALEVGAFFRDHGPPRGESAEEGAAGADAAEFLFLKHFFALRLALEALTGRAPGGAGAECAVARVEADASGGLELQADLSLRLATERIRSCGLCRGCASHGSENL